MDFQHLQPFVFKIQSIYIYVLCKVKEKTRKKMQVNVILDYPVCKIITLFMNSLPPRTYKK